MLPNRSSTSASTPGWTASGVRGSWIAREVQAGSYNYLLQLNSTGTVTALFTPADGTGGTNVSVTTTQPLLLDTWTHVLASFDGTQGRLFIRVNGVDTAVAMTPD